MLENFFKLKENGTTVKTEIIAGITTFFAMAYIIFVNPPMLSYGDSAVANGVFFATCISAFVGTILMALLARLPFAQASGMGLNAFFAYTVMPQMGKLAGIEDMAPVEQYQTALAIVFISGLLFIAITILGMREAIVKAIPHNIKIAITGGIGLFLAFLGLQNAKIVQGNESTLVGLLNFNFAKSDYVTAMGAIITIIGVVLIAALYARKIKGSILIGMASCTVLAYVTGVAKLPESISFNFAAQAKDFVDVSFFHLNFGNLFGSGNILGSISTILVLIISFSLVDMFDTIGTLLGTAKRANLLDENGEMPRMKQALLCDSIATSAGALLGTSTVTTYVESSAGIGEGGKTGLTSLTTAILFLVALVLAPVVGLVPSVATAPALIVVGAMMLSGVKDIDFTDFSETVPAFLTIAMMPLSYSIANGIAFGLISYVLIKLICGKIKETHWITWLLAAFFILRFALGVY
jgi:AGZA family xanthine/uracil permease-like MFS transporter